MNRIMPPKVCVLGAGAIGGLIGGMLARSGIEVSLITRGDHLEALRQRGLTLILSETASSFPVRSSESGADFGVQDYVFLTLKATSLASVPELLKPIIGPATTIVTAANGIPWWYFHGVAGRFVNRSLQSTDSGQTLSRSIALDRIIGAALFMSAEITSPGTITHRSGLRIVLGEPSGTISQRLLELVRLVKDAGMDAQLSDNIRRDIWIKLWANVSFNPISMLTGATIGEIASDPELRGIARAMMVEARAVAEALGIEFNIDPDIRLAQLAAVGGHKTSMLQDLERGREIEFDAVVGAVQEIGAWLQVPTPTIDLIAALAKEKGKQCGVYHH